MSQATSAALALPIVLSSDIPAPLYRQLYDGLRRAILAGLLPTGTRLPSSRDLARELGVSRNTVVNAFDQLLAEGYLESKVGDGTYVSHVLPDELLSAASGVHTRRTTSLQIGLSQRGQVLAATAATKARDQQQYRAFRPGLPAFEAFPFEIWSKLATKHWRSPRPELLAYGEPAGYGPLREAIATYVGASRGVTCTPEQVIVVSGSQQGLDLVTRLLLDPGDAVWMEDPGYLGARGVFIASGASIIPVPVDKEGLDITAGKKLSPTARLAYVTPSHQYPLGVTMSLSRRLALLEWAKQTDAWILEDDYDSEYRYASRPLPALQGLDSEGRTLYLGTVSKVLAPSLRLGYVVVPPNLVEAFVAARALSDRHGPSVEQAVLADFMTEGHLARHIRRTRTLYAERQAILVQEARKQLSGLLDVQPAEAGMHMIGWLPDGVSDTAIAQQAAANGVIAQPLSDYALTPYPRAGLLLGYAAFNATEIAIGVRRLAQVLRRATISNKA